MTISSAALWAFAKEIFLPVAIGFVVWRLDRVLKKHDANRQAEADRWVAIETGVKQANAQGARNNDHLSQQDRTMNQLLVDLDSERTAFRLQLGDLHTQLAAHSETDAQTFAEVKQSMQEIRDEVMRTGGSIRAALGIQNLIKRQMRNKSDGQ